MTPPNPSWRLPVAFPGPHSGLLRQWPTLWVASAPDTAFLRFRECLLAPPNPSWRLPVAFPGPRSGPCSTSSVADALGTASLRFRECLLTPPNPSWRLPVAFPGPHSGPCSTMPYTDAALGGLTAPDTADALAGISSRHCFSTVSRLPFDTSKSLVAPSCRFPWLWSMLYFVSGRRFGCPQLQTQLVCGRECLLTPPNASCGIPVALPSPCPRSTPSVADAFWWPELQT